MTATNICTTLGENFYREGIEKLVTWYNKCLDKHSNYVEIHLAQLIWFFGTPRLRNPKKQPHLILAPIAPTYHLQMLVFSVTMAMFLPQDNETENRAHKRVPQTILFLP